MTVPINAEMGPAGPSGPAITPQALADLLGRWPTADGALYRLLATRLSRLADTGELPAGVRLPPERALAAALSVSRNTVALAYQVLRDEGMAASRQGSGTRLVPHRTTPAAVHRANGFFAGLLSAAPPYDLSVAAVDCAPQVAAALVDPAAVLDEAERRRLTLGTGYLPYGLPELRAAVASMLTTYHGVPTSPAQVLITTGAQQALDLLLRCEVAPGHPVVTENPTYPGFIDALHRSGARPVGVPPGDMARLADAVTVHRPALAYLMPTHQNPTGLVLPAAERHEIVALAARHQDVTFVDDMTVAELPLAPGTDEGPQPPPLAALAPRLPNVVTVGSLSKTYWGGLRTGWVRAPEGIISRLAAAKSAADLGTAPVQQGLVAALVRMRHEEIIAYRASWARERYAAMAAALATFLPGWAWTAPAGGLTVWARRPGDADSGGFAQAALRHGVAVVPGRLLSVSADRSPWVRLAFTLPPDDLITAVKTLATV